VAEETGLIVPIGAWVMRAGLPADRRLAARRAAADDGGDQPVGPPVRDAGLIDTVRRALRETGVPAARWNWSSPRPWR
jgi:EAL domain-containing protein (putative c-di-GMP-specific phosphodiesterase class I)